MPCLHTDMSSVMDAPAIWSFCCWSLTDLQACLPSSMLLLSSSRCSRRIPARLDFSHFQAVHGFFKRKQKKNGAFITQYPAARHRSIVKPFLLIPGAQVLQAYRSGFQVQAVMDFCLPVPHGSAIGVVGAAFLYKYAWRKAPPPITGRYTVRRKAGSMALHKISQRAHLWAPAALPFQRPTPLDWSPSAAVLPELFHRCQR